MSTCSSFYNALVLLAWGCWLPLILYFTWFCYSFKTWFGLFRWRHVSARYCFGFCWFLALLIILFMLINIYLPNWLYPPLICHGVWHKHILSGFSSGPRLKYLCSFSSSWLMLFKVQIQGWCFNLFSSLVVLFCSNLYLGYCPARLRGVWIHLHSLEVPLLMLAEDQSCSASLPAW